jgi:hypothetical protein
MAIYDLPMLDLLGHQITSGLLSVIKGGTETRHFDPFFILDKRFARSDVK